MNPVRERGRRKLVAVITFVYLLLIFEGTLRKWVFPQFGQILFFIRDPFVLIAYGLAFRHGFFPRSNPFMWIGLGFGLIAVLLVGAQTFNSNASGTLLLAAYGWRNYFYYIPLAFVIGECFQRQDLERIVRWTLILAIPTAVLVFAQFMSPLNSPINVGSGDEAFQFRGLAINGDHTRPMGFFTSDVGQREFTVSAFAMVFSLWLATKARRYVKLWLLLPCTCAVLSCLAVSGSRGAMLHCGIVMIAAMACAFVIRGGGVSKRAVIWPTVIGVAAVALYPILFPEGFAAFMGRWNQAAADETRYFSLGIFGRALYGFVDFFSLVGDAPLAGWGLGLAGNARITLGIQIEGFTGWAETDWARHIVDLGPVVGILFILYRIAFVGWLGLHCLRGARRLQDALPVLLFAYVGMQMLYGQISGHGTINGYAWLFTGFCLAAVASRRTDEVTAPATNPMLLPPRFANLMR
jgi:hypothetical protein